MGKRLNSAPMRTARRSRDPAEELRVLYGLDSRALRDFSLVAPRCSIAFGASGIAYSLARATELIDAAGRLMAANSWIAAPTLHASSKRAFVSSSQRITRPPVGFASVAFAEPGLFYAKGIIRSRMKDPAGADNAARQFLSVTKNRLSRFADVHLGGLGLALAAKRFTDCVSSARVRSELSTLSHSLVRRAWAKTGTDIRRNRLLGFAHGIAGQVFASYACGHPQTAIPFVQQLREIAIPDHKELIWPLRAGSGDFSAGWCNGLAGHLLMWTKVWQHSRAQEDREMLDRLASGVWKYRPPVGSLCCGAAGQAIILASISSATGDHHWNRKALAWLRCLRPGGPRHAPPQSRFHGRLGLLLARIECEYATRPQFPVYQRDSIDLPSLNN